MTGIVLISKSGVCGGLSRKSSSNEAVVVGKEERQRRQQQQQLSFLEFLLSALRKSMVSCRIDRQEDAISSSAIHHMEIGWPTNVQHVTHVTFDRFHGFLGLPVEFEVEVPCRVPSASVSVFGVSAESMQCSYDARGNSVPTILLLMQDRLLSQGGLKAEGIFRINPENSKEEHVRDQLNRGIVPEDIDVHCLAGLIKAWFRELPSGVLDGLSPEQVLECNTEEDSVELIEQLKPTARALLNWAVDLMADVVEHEGFNKMNARNIAMVFAPNMTQMSDPLTALMHAVQVMNLLKTLIMRTLREREYTMVDEVYSPRCISCHSSTRRLTDDEMESQEEDMDNTSCESTGPISDDDDDDNDANLSLRRSDVESLSDIEESFLRQLGENENAKNDFKKQLEGILIRQQHVTPSISSISSASTFKAADSCWTPSNSNVGSSCLTTSDGEDSKTRSVSVRLKEGVATMRSSDSNINNVVVDAMVNECSLPPACIRGKSTF